MPVNLWDPVNHHESAQADESLSWLNLDALVQATHAEDAQTDNISDNSWFIDMLLGNNAPLSASPSAPAAQVSHEEASPFPESTGILDDFVKDLQAALSDPTLPESLNENHDASRLDDINSEDGTLDLDWWRQWINEDIDDFSDLPTSMSTLGTSSVSSTYAGDELLFNESLTDYSISDDFAEMTISSV